MPQLRPRGKHVYGWSLIREGNILYFPPEIINEYFLEIESDIVLFSGSKSSGGFCISKLEILKSSKLSKIVEENPELDNKENIGHIIKYKGRNYCHLKMNAQNNIKLNQDIMNQFNLKKGDELLIIRGSDIAFDCILKGPLVELAKKSDEEIKIY